MRALKGEQRMEAHIEIPVAYDRPQHPLPITEFDEPDEWAYAWDRLTTTPPSDKQEVCSHCSEVWHYLGSVLRPSTTGATILHQFRHGHHPRTKNRRYELIPASPAFQRRHGCK